MLVIEATTYTQEAVKVELLSPLKIAKLVFATHAGKSAGVEKLE